MFFRSQSAFSLLIFKRNTSQKNYQTVPKLFGWFNQSASIATIEIYEIKIS
jgi:hypothetical protein